MGKIAERKEDRSPASNQEASASGPSHATFTRCHILDTGYCLTLENTLLRGGWWWPVRCHATVALLRHPKQGWVLWDTGYAPRILEATRRLPGRLYRLATPMRLSPDLSVVAQLPALGLTSRDVRWVVLSHLHGDHIAGLRDFPHARLVVTQAAYDYAAARRGVRAVRRGFLPELMPDDFADRATLLPEFAGPPLGALGPTHDLFEDGSLLLVALPGHARGQIGMLAATESGRMLFVADACLHSASIRDQRLPGRATALITDDRVALQATIARLHRFAEANPEVTCLPTHCPEIFRAFVKPRLEEATPHGSSG